MDYEEQDRSFSTLVETQTLDDILSPIADKVSTLLRLLKVRDGVPFPDLFTPARKLDVAVKEMVEIAKSVIDESPSEELQANMSMACNQLLPAAQELMEAARQLGRRPTPDAQSWLGSAAHGVFEGTLKVLLVWDDGEVYKIVSACYDVLDKLALVQGVKSMRSLAVCFRGFSEAVTSLFHLVETRRRVLTVPQKKNNIQVAWKNFQATIPKLSLTMQSFVKNQDNIEVKRSRDSDIEKTSNTIYNLIRAIEKVPMFDENEIARDQTWQEPKDAENERDEQENQKEEEDDDDNDESLVESRIPRNMSGSIMKVQHYLQSSSPYLIDPKFDKHIDAILHNSMTVASMSNDTYKQVITQLCEQLKSLRASLHKCLGNIRANPNSEKAKASFDETAVLICKKLRELDHWVAQAVVNEVTETFGVGDDPIDHLVEAATAPTRSSKSKHTSGAPNEVSPMSLDSDKGLTQHVELFRRHSKRLSIVAQAAAQSTADALRGERIQSLAAELEQLTALVVQAALDVKNDPSNRECKERLHTLRKEWARAVRELTVALDEVINPEEFIALSIDNISHDLKRCQAAMEAGDRLELAARVQMIAAKAERVAEVVMAEVEEQPCSEEYKANLVGKVTHLRKSVTAMKSHASRYLDDPSSKQSYDAFVCTVKEVLDIIKHIQAALEEVIVEEVFSSTELHEYETTPTALPPQPAPKPTLTKATTTIPLVTKVVGGASAPSKTRGFPKPHHLGAVGTLKLPILQATLRPAPHQSRRQQNNTTAASGSQTVPLRTTVHGPETDHTPHGTGHTPHATGHTSHETGHTSQGTGHTPHATGYTPQGTGHTPHGTGHTPHGTGHTYHGTGHTPHGTGHTSHGTGHTPHGTGHTSHGTGHTPHGTGHTSHGTGHTPHGTGHTSHGTGHTPHGTGHTPHGTGHTSHGTGHTSHGTGHSPYSTYHNPRADEDSCHVTDVTSQAIDHTPHVTDPDPHVTDPDPHVTDPDPHVTDPDPHVTDHMVQLADHTTQTPPPIAAKRAPVKTTGAESTPSGTKDSPAAGLQAYSSPLQGLVSAAKAGASTQIPDCATILSERANRLVQMARSVASAATSTPELSRALEMKAREVVRLTPSLIRHAERIARDPRSMKELEALEADISQWAGHVRYLIDATQKANLPWSKTAEKLVMAAKTGEGLQTQIKHVSTQTEKMIGIALASVQAAEREEAIGCTSESSLQTQDPQVQAEMQHVQSLVDEIRNLTPELIKAAGDASHSGSVEPLRLVAHEWATKAKALMKGVDDLSLGMGGPADALVISAGSQDPTLLEEHTKNVKGLASTLRTVAMDSVAGCPDPAQVKEVQVTAKNIEEVSNQLAECASELMTMEEENESPDTRQATEEKKELLCRDWATQVHLLTAHVDELTAHVTTPLDSLVSIALEASKTELAKDHLMSQFKAKARRMRRQMELLREIFNKEVKGKVGERQQAVDNSDRAISFLIKLSPRVVGAARALSNEPASALLDHYHHLRRQWASKAHYLGTNLKMITGVDVQPVLDAFEQLIHGTLSPLNTSAEDDVHSPVTKAYSTENIPDHLSGFDLKNMMGKAPNAPHTGPLKKKMSADLDRPRMGEVVLRPPHRLPWGARMESNGEQVSNPILEAAQSLRDTTDKYEEEGNAIIAVAKELPQLTTQLAAFARGTVAQESREDMTDLTATIVDRCQRLAEFANLVAKQCTDQINKDNLQACAVKIPTLTTQLRILTSVKASTPDDLSAGVMLVKNIQNLMQAVTSIIHAAEAASVKGIQHVPDSEATAFALNWKKKLYNQRTMEAIIAPTGARGLRKLSKQYRSSLQSLINDAPPKTYESH